MPYTIEKLKGLLKAELIGKGEGGITRLLTDSRSLSFPEETLFFAITTANGDGHKYIDELYEKGVRNFVISKPIEQEKFPKANFLLVTNTLTALQNLAEKHRKRFNIPIVGITGSDGKTMVKEWLYQIIGESKVVTRSPRSYNSQIGVPLSVWLLDKKTEVGIFEAGISELREMDHLQKIIKPTIGVITNISGAHQENFTSLQEKCIEKVALFKSCDTIVYNGDDTLLSSTIARSLLSSKEIAWSRKDMERPLYIKSIKKEENCTHIEYRYLAFDNSYTIPFIDEASIENSINCLAVALYLMIPPEVISQRMSMLEPIAMRLEVKEGKRGTIIINDSYNSDLASLDIALDFLERRCASLPEHKRTLILSDMKQTGQTTRSLYKMISQYVEKRGVEKLIGIGSDISSEAKRFSMEKHFFPSTEAFINSELFNGLHNEIILIKGARRFYFENISEALEQKVHQTILEINLSALRNNLNHYRRLTKSGTKITCMVKASAYGAGSLEVARTLQDARVDYLAVAVADEGAEIRKAGISTDILIMNPELTSLHTLFSNKLEPEVYSFRILDALIQAASREGITDYPIHIKLDTGMHRLGFLNHEVPQLVERLKKQSALTPRSIFSHFAGSDSSQFDYFTQQQFTLFNDGANTIQQAFPHYILRHICNTAAIERFPNQQQDMVRLGLGLYGINPIDNSPLEPISTLKSVILQIHEVPGDETVGYSRRGTLKHTSRIAALPIGYADGLNRKLGNGKGYCLVNGKTAPYIGNICMDVCMIDVTGIECKEGDNVEIFGKNLPVSKLAEWLDTIPYEVLTGVSSRIKRIFYCD